MEGNYDDWAHKAYHEELALTFDHSKRIAPTNDYRVDNEDSSIEVDIQWIIERHMPEYLEQQKPTIIIYGE